MEILTFHITVIKNMIHIVTNKDIITEWVNQRNISLETNFFKLLVELSFQYSSVDLSSNYKTLIFRLPDPQSIYFPEFRAGIHDNTLEISFYSEVTLISISMHFTDNSDAVKASEKWDFLYPDLFKSLININAERIARIQNDSA